MSDAVAERGVVVPFDLLSAEALEGVIDDYITREGTEYGHAEQSLQEKRHQVLQQLRSGEAHIDFDEDSKTCTLIASSSREVRGE